MTKRTKRMSSFEAGMIRVASMVIARLAAKGISSSMGGSGEPLVVAVAGGSADGGCSEVTRWLKEKLGGVVVMADGFADGGLICGLKERLSGVKKEPWLIWDGLTAIQQLPAADIKIFVDIGLSGRVGGSLLRLLKDGSEVSGRFNIFDSIKIIKAGDNQILGQRENTDLIIRYDQPKLKSWRCNPELRPKFRLPEGKPNFGNLAVSLKGREYHSDWNSYHLDGGMACDQFLRLRRNRAKIDTLTLTYCDLGLQPAQLKADFEVVVEPQVFNSLKTCCGPGKRIIKRRDVYALDDLIFAIERVVTVDPLFSKKKYLGQFLKIYLSKRMPICQAKAYWAICAYFGWREKDAILTPYAKM